MKKIEFFFRWFLFVGVVVAAASSGGASRSDEPLDGAVSAPGVGLGIDAEKKPDAATPVDLPKITAPLDRDAERDGARFFNGKVDPLRRDASGAQTLYPAVGKIIGRGAAEEKEDGAQAIPLYYGTCVYVAESGEFGIVLTNWHVVSESDESIEAIFPNFSSEAKILLRDEIWDLTALIVRKPPEIAPLPIALEVPRIGETLWVAGYGQSGGLADFQIQSGRLLNYVELFEPKNLPIETLAVGEGVRAGDSGGPIFNRYGEIAGILWGSDGKVTMGTFCVRAQFFLTQALQRLTALYAERSLDADGASAANDFLSWSDDDFGASAVASDESSEKLVKDYGVFPISQKPVYVSPDGRLDAESLSRAERADALQSVEDAASNVGKTSAISTPPSPPIFSPTFVVQQRNVKRARPEVAEPGFYENWNESARIEIANARATSAENAKVARTRPADARESASVAAVPNAVVSNDGRDDSASRPNENDAASSTTATLRPISAEKRDVDVENAVASPEESVAALKNGASNDRNDESRQADETRDASLSERPTSLSSLSGLQIYVVICAVFCLFYNAGRLLAPKKSRRQRVANVDDARPS